MWKITITFDDDSRRVEYADTEGELKEKIKMWNKVRNVKNVTSKFIKAK